MSRDALEIETAPLGADEWHALLTRFDDASLEQTSAYAAARAPANALEHVVVRRAGKVAAAAQLSVRRVPGARLGVAVVKFGPMGCAQREAEWGQGERGDAAPDEAALSACVAALRSKWIETDGLSVRVMPAAVGAAPSRRALQAALEQAGFEHTPIAYPDRFLVDLEIDSEPMRAGLKPKWRYNLKRSMRHGLALVEDSTDAWVARFMQLYEAMHSRKRFDDTSGAADYPLFHASLPKRLRPRLFFCWHGAVVVGGLVVSCIGRTAVYLYGATLPQALPLGAGYFMQWQVIEQLRALQLNGGARWYDLGGHGGDAGLEQFKSGLVGRTGQCLPLPGVYDLHPGVLRGALVRGGLELRELAGVWRARLDKLAQSRDRGPNG